MSDLIERNEVLTIIRACAMSEEISPRIIYQAVNQMSPAQLQDKVLLDKEAILQAGYQGKEVEFRIGGRLFAIREKAQ